jgi:hypothetical protein
MEQLAYLLMPLWQTIVGVTLAVAAVLALTGEADFWTPALGGSSSSSTCSGSAA